MIQGCLLDTRTDFATAIHLWQTPDARTLSTRLKRVRMFSRSSTGISDSSAFLFGLLGKSSILRLDSSSSKTVQKPEKLELDLPGELVEQIMSLLCSGDRARASCVCRKWRDIAKSLKKTNRPPMNVNVQAYDEFFDICDLSRCLTKVVIIPNRPKGIVSYAKDGWMLFYHNAARAMNFYNPQSDEVVELPTILPTVLIDMAAFSAPPMSPNCAVFLLPITSLPGSPDVLIWRPGDMLWTFVEYDNKRHRSITSTWINVVVRNGKFYCMNIHGYMGEFDPVKCSWRALPYEPLGCAQSVPSYGWGKSFYMAEYGSEFFLVRIWGVAKPIVYKSDGISCTWKRVKHLDGATFFASTTTSLVRDELPNPMRNCIYFPECVDDGRHCLVYSMKLKKFYRKMQKLDRWKTEYYYDDVWMDIGDREVPVMEERDDVARMNRDVAAAFGRMHLKAFGTELVA
ncbi:F-box/kelch-repeat protein At1g57790-like [Andrographis paniculata]|uniref:F-box/kelch-repeat protein At1g57790-like n=1 Tax=Andrographis paniculata TaxID=175694 RepID=UPI0021E92AD9|nr:F-box/kelch-repeat protein At1g57790-like [Andrographis paniculata]